MKGSADPCRCGEASTRTVKGGARACNLYPQCSDDDGWECQRCFHINVRSDDDCMGEKCIAFRKWASEQLQEDKVDEFDPRRRQ